MKYIGIDISKSSFVAAFSQGEGFTTSKYTNDLNGINLFLAQLDRSFHHCVLEATGNYGALLVEDAYSS
ncbi:hypothetical protein [Cardinium endosymbiont of Nabis limbatus]|uniref:hypothetical protein n=1 Tax=Cardinium endosymbiont of Nabis limbatus TaxID=3066217 RepID=UPI003AF3C3F8